METIIHVNHHHSKHNRKAGKKIRPVLSVKQSGRVFEAREAAIIDPLGERLATIIYRPEAPLSCGAEVWIETENRVLYRA
jgi:hypothetical protein